MKYICFVALKYSNSRRQDGPKVISTALRVMSLFSSWINGLLFGLRCVAAFLAPSVKSVY